MQQHACTCRMALTATTMLWLGEKERVQGPAVQVWAVSL